MNQSINHPNNESSDVSINQSITQFILPRLYPDREVAIEFFRSGVSRLTRLRHPRLLTVQHPLEESRDSLAFCTEPVFASLANILEARSNAEKQRHPALKGSFPRYRRKRRKLFFFLDEISFRRDYKSCQVGVVDVVRATFMETLRWDNFCNFGATLLGFGTLFTNIILLWIRNFEKNRTTPTPKKNQKTPKKDLWIFTMGYLANALS